MPLGACGVLRSALRSREILGSGAFAFANSAAKSRFIGDRRLENFDDGALYDVALPYGPRLRRLRIPTGFSARGNLRDASDFYFIWRVPEERLQRQLIGPRLPRSWFAQLDEKFDDAQPEGDWYWDDLHPFGSDRSAVDCSATHLNFALTAIMVGDTNGVLVAESVQEVLSVQTRFLSQGILSRLSKLGMSLLMCASMTFLLLGSFQLATVARLGETRC